MPGNIPWVDAGIVIQAGQTVSVRATGLILFRVPESNTARIACQTGPAGTYHFDDGLVGKPFPLPAAGSGPAPCFALLGKFGGASRPFYIGEHVSIVALESGPLWLGVNDFDHQDNTGSLTVTVTVGEGLEPVAIRRRVLPGGPEGRPRADSSVVIFYVDGLRPDVVEEMAAMGHLPHLTELFLKGGTKLENACTVFPADTITSNGSLWTGCFSDRHGMKGQMGFNRHTGRSENYLGKLGPMWSDMLLNPQGLDKALLAGGSTLAGAVGGKDEGLKFRQKRSSNTPTLTHYLAEHNRSIGSGVLPIMSDLSPSLWTRYLADEAPYLGTQKADRFVDEANAAYAVEHLLRRKDAVTLVWLPETDTVSHHEYRGQFGMARRTLAEVDRMIGDVAGHLRRQGRLENTYLILVSDHGHIGGRFSHLHRYDLANEFFHRPREVNQAGQWVGGGLGLSVRQYRYENNTRGDGRSEFVFVDAWGDGVGRVSLPKGHYRSGDWSGPNRIGDLLRYKISDRLPPVDLIQAATRIVVKDLPDGPQSPIDLVLAKIDEHSILVSSGHRGSAVIDRRTNAEGRYEYRYRVVDDLQPTLDGSLTFRLVPEPRIDPLRLVGHVEPELIGTYQDERSWLNITLGTPYPDGVVTMTRHLLWQPHLAPREQAYAPDLVITCGPDWQFNTINEPGTAHGHPYHETMQFSFFVAGPGVRRGAVLTDPVRSVDLLPTVLEMVGAPYDASQIDGQPIHTLYETAANEPHVVLMPLSWQDIDLGGWDALEFRPRRVYPIQPRSVDRPNSFWDLNNLVYNTLSVSELSVNRMVDDTARLFGRTRRPARRVYREAQVKIEEQSHLTRPRDGSEKLTDGSAGLHLNKISIGDYSWYSSGNLQRMSNAVDWLQYRATRFDRRLASPLGTKTVLGTPVTNTMVDSVQYSAWELRRFGTKAVVQVMDEWLLNGLENSANRVLNAGRSEPAEVPTASE